MNSSQLRAVESDMLNIENGYYFDCVRGVQSREEFYVTTMTAQYLKCVLQEFFNRTKPDSPLDMAQRTLSTKRAEGVKDYIRTRLTQPDGFYILPPIVMTVDSFDMQFQEYVAEHPKAGELWVNSDATFWCPDGQTRAYGQQLAYLAAAPIMAYEEIAVMLLLDEGSKRKQQIFLDINGNAMKPNKSIMALFDHADETAAITCAVLTSVPIFNGRTALEATNITTRSGDFFTLNALRDGTRYLIKGHEGDRQAFAVKYWKSVSKNLPDWQLIQKAADPIAVRDQSIAFHAITLNALGMVGAGMPAKDWDTSFKKLNRIDWKRSNPDWEGLFMSSGKIRKTTATTQALASYILSLLENEM